MRTFPFGTLRLRDGGPIEPERLDALADDVRVDVDQLDQEALCAFLRRASEPEQVEWMLRINDLEVFQAVARYGPLDVELVRTILDRVGLSDDCAANPRLPIQARDELMEATLEDVSIHSWTASGMLEAFHTGGHTLPAEFYDRLVRAAVEPSDTHQPRLRASLAISMLSKVRGEVVGRTLARIFRALPTMTDIHLPILRHPDASPELIRDVLDERTRERPLDGFAMDAVIEGGHFTPELRQVLRRFPLLRRAVESIVPELPPEEWAEWVAEAAEQMLHSRAFALLDYADERQRAALNPSRLQPLISDSEAEVRQRALLEVGKVGRDPKPTIEPPLPAATPPRA